MAFLAKKNLFDLALASKYKIIVYKIGNQYAHYVLDVFLKDISAISSSYFSLFTITSSNMLVLSSALETPNGESVYQIRRYAKVRCIKEIPRELDTFLEIEFLSHDSDPENSIKQKVT